MRPGNGWELVNRWLRKGKWVHAYLLVGPEGGEHETAAEHFAKGILCENEGSRPCGACLSCRRWDHGNHPDFLRVVPDGQSVKLDQVQGLQQFFRLQSVSGDRRVYVLHGADRMTPEAANSLLKFLEEPVFGVVGILTAVNGDGVLPTVRSRCQTIHFPSPSREVLQQRWTARGLGEERARLFSYLGLVPADGDTVRENGESASNDASQEVRFAEIADWVVEWIQAVEQRRGNPLLDILERVGQGQWSSADCEWFLDVVACWYRDLLYTSLGLPDEVVFVDHRRELSSQAARNRSITAVTEKLQEVIAAKRRLQVHANAQLALECMVLRLQGE
ncbi:MAG: DNA polymerase III subunit delta' [Alicyclobacillaceae bacterium]|nr:DNA polymerase III subunit delta' [Alicyclobacillaceae bacterium]